MKNRSMLLAASALASTLLLGACASPSTVSAASSSNAPSSSAAASPSASVAPAVEENSLRFVVEGATEGNLTGAKLNASVLDSSATDAYTDSEIDKGFIFIMNEHHKFSTEPMFFTSNDTIRKDWAKAKKKYSDRLTKVTMDDLSKYMKTEPGWIPITDEIEAKIDREAEHKVSYFVEIVWSNEEEYSAKGTALAVQGNQEITLKMKDGSTSTIDNSFYGSATKKDGKWKMSGIEWDYQA